MSLGTYCQLILHKGCVHVHPQGQGMTMATLSPSRYPTWFPLCSVLRSRFHFCSFWSEIQKPWSKSTMGLWGYFPSKCIIPGTRTSLVAQWLRIHLPMQGTRVWALVQKIPHAAEQLSLHSRAREPQLLSLRATTTEAHMPRARAPQQEKPLQWEARALQRGVVPAGCN